MVSVGIIGASGYTGAELLRLVAQHPDLDVVYATGDTQAGGAAADAVPEPGRGLPGPGLRARSTPTGSPASTSSSSACPTRPRMALAPQPRTGKVGCLVDLSAAFRLKDASLYPRWYGFEHDQPELLADAVYGLPELYRADLEGRTLIATPGCYVTAALAGPGPARAARA